MSSKKVTRVMVAATVLAAAILFGTLMSDSVVVNAVGLATAATLEGAMLFKVRSILHTDAMSTYEERFQKIKQFSGSLEIPLRDDQIRTIAEGSFHSDLWNDEVCAMSVSYANIGAYIKANPDRSLLRVYMAAFPGKIFSVESQEQARILADAVENIKNAFKGHVFYSNQEAMDYLNGSYGFNLNESLFDILKVEMEKRGVKIRIKNSGALGLESVELRIAKNKYDQVTNRRKE